MAFPGCNLQRLARNCEEFQKMRLTLLWISHAPCLTPRMPERSIRSMQNRFVPEKNESETDMPVPNDIAGTAALSICESLLLALNDRQILPEREIMGVLRDAAAAHEFAPDADHAEMHAAVAALINGILAGGNSVRRR